MPGVVMTPSEKIILELLEKIGNDPWIGGRLSVYAREAAKKMRAQLGEPGPRE